MSSLPHPFGAPFDVVIPWVDFADVGYCQRFGRAPPPSPRGFFELRMLLRSLARHGWLAHIRDVVVVHSDHHPPPSFLRATHPRLRFVSHAEFAPAAHLPLLSLEAICAHVHRIEGLTPWILFAEDDGIVMTSIDVFQEFVWRLGRFVVLASSTALSTVPASASTWERGAAEAARVLAAEFGPRERRLDLHTPHLLHVPTLTELAARFPQSPDAPVFNRVVLHNEFLIDCGLARRYPFDTTRAAGRHLLEELHTNGHGFYAPVTLRTALRLAVRLQRAERRVLFLNAQGPGISAEYDDAGAHGYGAIYDAWLARTFPTPSPFEPDEPDEPDDPDGGR